MLNQKDLKKLELLLKEATKKETLDLIDNQVIKFNKLLLKMKNLNKDSIDKAKRLLQAIEGFNEVILALITFKTMVIGQLKDDTHIDIFQHSSESFVKFGKLILSIKESLRMHNEFLERDAEEQHYKRLASPRLSYDANESSITDDGQVDELFDQVESNNIDLLRCNAHLITKIFKSNLLKKVIDQTQNHFDIKTTQFFATGEVRIDSFTHVKQLDPFKKYLEAWMKPNTAAIEIMRGCIQLENAMSHSTLLIAKHSALSEYKELGKHLRANELPIKKKVIKIDESDADLEKGKSREKIKIREISVADTTPSHAKNIASVIKLIDEIDDSIEIKRKKLEALIKPESVKPPIKKHHARQRSASHSQLFFIKASELNKESKKGALNDSETSEIQKSAPKRGETSNLSSSRKHLRQRSKSTNALFPAQHAKPTKNSTSSGARKVRPASMLIKSRPIVESIEQDKSGDDSLALI